MLVTIGEDAESCTWSLIWLSPYLMLQHCHQRRPAFDTVTSSVGDEPIRLSRITRGLQGLCALPKDELSSEDAVNLFYRSPCDE